MKAASQPLFDCLVEILVKVFKTAYTQLAKISVPVLMRADDAINIRRRVSQVNPKLPSSKPVRFAREGDRAGRVWQLFAVILKGVQVLSVINEKAWHAAPSGQKAPCAEVDHEAAGGDRVENDIA